MSSLPEFDWPDFLALARELVVLDELAEAAKRSAISRAYYAAFNVVKGFLKSRGHTVPDTGEAHDLVWGICKNDAGVALRRVGCRGKGLQSDRGRADYDRPFPADLTQTAQFSLSGAELIIDLIRTERAKTQQG